MTSILKQRKGIRLIISDIQGHFSVKRDNIYIKEHHYGENVSKIKLDGIAPFANSYNFDVTMYLQNKKLKKN
jgi:hypothetical protein